MDFDARDPHRREVGNPERPIGADGDRLNRIILKPIGHGQQTAHLPLLNVQPLIAGDEQALPGGSDVGDAGAPAKGRGTEFEPPGARQQAHDAVAASPPKPCRSSSRSIPLIENFADRFGTEDRRAAGRSGDCIVPARSPRSERSPPTASHRLPRPIHTRTTRPRHRLAETASGRFPRQPRNNPRLVPIHSSPVASRTMRHMDGLARPSSSAKLCHCSRPSHRATPWPL